MKKGRLVQAEAEPPRRAKMMHTRDQVHVLSYLGRSRCVEWILVDYIMHGTRRQGKHIQLHIILYYLLHALYIMNLLAFIHKLSQRRCP
jgi:hypothetical protein